MAIKKKKLEDLPLQDLMIIYAEAVRVANDCDRMTVVGNSLEETNRYRKEVGEFNGYAEKVNNLIKSKLREICG